MSPQLTVVASAQTLIGADELETHPGARVLVIEDSDARPQLAGNGTLIVAYSGAPQRWGWPALKGRAIDILPAATAQAWQQALTIKGYLVSLDCQVSLIDTRTEPESWDLQDFIAEGGTSASLATYVESHRESSASATSPVPASSHAVTEALEQLPDFRYRKHREAWEHFDLEMGPGGRPWANSDTATTIISQHPETRTALWFDEFRNRTMLGERDFDEKWDAAELCLVMQRDIHIQKMSTATVSEACVTYAKRNGRHPVREWLSSLPPWDGCKRLERLINLAFGATEDDYTASIGRCFMIGMVARVMNPGCQLDTMPVFEGGQGIGKTSALRILGGEWYSSNNASMQEKDFLQGLQGYWLIEIEELESVNRSSLERTKAILSRTRDDFRWSHGKNVRSYPRQCVFAGSTNSDSWNADSSGARRFWPVACSSIDLPWLRAHRAALYAEAMVRYLAGEDWYKVPSERAREEQELRRLEDSWTGDIERNIAGRTEYTIEDGMRALELKPIERNRGAAMRIADILKTLGWRVKIVKKGTKSSRIYRPISQLVEKSAAERDEFGDDVPY